jgi:cell division protein ZapE
MTPLDYYQRKIASGEILEDAQQLAVMQEFQKIYQDLTSNSGFIERFRKKTPRGIYLWGSVGIGKTFLVDTFFYTLPFDEKLRIHFYAFMREVHAELKKFQGSKNPLQQIAKNWAKKTKIICFDELIVNDIGDAMVLGGLIEALLDQGICLVFTSNVEPDDLYKNGIQREQFEPAIQQIKQHCEVIHLGIAEDYRETFAEPDRYYLFPMTTRNIEKMEQLFLQFADAASISTAPLTVCHREIKVIKQSKNVVWFDFLTICGKPRSHEDYLALAEKFSTIFVSNLAAISSRETDLARSFIRFVDVLYDAKIRLIINAAQPIDKIYIEGELLFEFERTKSRLVQMQSAQWFGS